MALVIVGRLSSPTDPSDTTTGNAGIPTSHGVFLVDASDDDGWITSVYVRWGHGTGEYLHIAPLTWCRDPQPQLAWPTSGTTATVRHPLPAGRVYTTTIYVTSAGCDAQSTDLSTFTFRHRAA